VQPEPLPILPLDAILNVKIYTLAQETSKGAFDRLSILRMDSAKPEFFPMIVNFLRTVAIDLLDIGANKGGLALFARFPGNGGQILDQRTITLLTLSDSLLAIP